MDALADLGPNAGHQLLVLRADSNPKPVQVTKFLMEFYHQRHFSLEEIHSSFKSVGA
jgi:hypothetical protein